MIDHEASLDECMEWYVRAALAVMDERARVYPPWCRARYAQRLGHPSYYALRVAEAQAAGYASLWAMRLALGWSTTHVGGL